MSVAPGLDLISRTSAWQEFELVPLRLMRAVASHASIQYLPVSEKKAEHTTSASADWLNFSITEIFVNISGGLSGGDVTIKICVYSLIIGHVLGLVVDWGI